MLVSTAGVALYLTLHIDYKDGCKVFHQLVVYVLFDCTAIIIGFNYNTVTTHRQEQAYRKLFFLHTEIQEVGLKD